jgi:hypothetical protein
MDRAPASPHPDTPPAGEALAAALGQAEHGRDAAAGAPDPGSLADDRALDAWLGRALRGLHDPVLSEPVPDHLLRILQAREDH